MQNYGPRIRAYRTGKNLTQGELAKLAGIDQAQISRFENGTIEGTPAQILAIARALGVTVSDIMGDTKEGCTDAARTKDGQISDEAMEFAKAYESLPPNQRAALRSVAQALVGAAEEQGNVKGA